MKGVLISDDFYDHPSVLKCSDGAIGLWIWAASSCALHDRMDGRVDASLVEGRNARLEAAELVDAGLWVCDPGGYRMSQAIAGPRIWKFAHFRIPRGFRAESKRQGGRTPGPRGGGR